MTEDHMNFLRCADMRRGILIYLAVGGAAAVIGYIQSVTAGTTALVMSAIFVLLYVLLTARRYSEISKLSQSIDRILHGQDEILFRTAARASLPFSRAR